MIRPRKLILCAGAFCLFLAGCELFGSDDDPEEKCVTEEVTVFGFRHLATGGAELCVESTPAGGNTLTVQNPKGNDRWGVLITMPSEADYINLSFEPIDIPVNTEITMSVAGELDGLGRVLGGLRQTTDAQGVTLLSVDFSGLADRITDEMITIRYYLQGAVQFEDQVPLARWVPLATYVDKDVVGKGAGVLGTSKSWHWVCSGTGDNRTCSLMSDSGPENYETLKRAAGKGDGLVVADLIEARVRLLDRPIALTQVEIAGARELPPFTITGEDNDRVVGR